MALRAGYYGVKRRIKDKIEEIVSSWDTTIASLFPRNEQAVLGAKNLLPNTAVSTTKNGITFTVNSDGSVTANGTATTDVDLTINNEKTFKTGSYILNGSPSGSSGTSYYLTVSGKGRDYGNGAEFTIDSDSVLTTFIRIVSGTTVNNLVFKPMIRIATDTDPAYAPYAMTNRELTASAADQKTTINAIITAATSAADFAAFKTAMGAITPVTRSLSTAAAPEEIVKDEIEDPVVEKKTTKKKSTAKAETTEEV